jgi:hypothetical protein
MDDPTTDDGRRSLLLLSSLGGLLGGLCCFPPIVLVLLGLAGVTTAANWGNLLYGEYRWYFRAMATVFLIAGMTIYFRRRGVCTLGQARRRRNWLINTCLLAGLTAISVHIFWTYVVLHYWGIAAGLPWAQYDESWAIPTSAVLFATLLLAFRVTQARRARSLATQTGHPEPAPRSR